VTWEAYNYDELDAPRDDAPRSKEVPVAR
jgi:hypothetical protein